MRIVNTLPTELTVDLDIKRLYLPGIKVHAKCPACGEWMFKDMTDDYISYVTTGKPFAIAFWCEWCDNEWAERATLHLSISPDNGEAAF